MHTLDEIHNQWSSVLEDLRSERERINVSVGQGLALEDCVSRGAVLGMSLAEVNHFYSSIIDKLTAYHAVDLFAIFEKFLFGDAEHRSKDKNARFHSVMKKLRNRHKAHLSVDRLIDKWQATLPITPDNADLFSRIADARKYRNWIAHGQRFPLQATCIPASDDVYLAVLYLHESIRQL